MPIQIIDETEQQLKQLEKLYDLLPDDTEKQTVSILDIFNKTYNENYISDFLAYILDPKQNGVGTGPLQKLVEFGKSEWESAYENPDAKVEIMREYVLFDNRRVDLVINMNDSLIIGIENKVFTDEHNQQTIDYAKGLKDRFKDCEYVFLLLSPEGKEPLSKEFKAMRYSELHHELASVQYDAVKDIRKTVIFEDFKTHLEEKFMNKNALGLSKKTELYIEYGKMIEDLKKNFEEDYKNILKAILQIATEQINQHSEEEIWEINSTDTRNYHQMYKKNWKQKDVFVHFELRMASSNLSSNHMVEFAVDIELAKKTEFIAKLEKDYSDKITNIISQNQLDKISRSLTYVSKKYELLTLEILKNREELQKHIEAMVNDFFPFIKIIDEMLEK